MLVGVTGMVGAGKSSLLCALTEQMYKVNGSVKIKVTLIDFLYSLINQK